MAPPRPRWEASKKATPLKSSKSEKPGRKKPTSDKNEAPTASAYIPLELQQMLLNIFKNSFLERLGDEIKPIVQEVKGHLYNRDFNTAFGKPEYLDAYALRWSASRAIGYADLLYSLKDQLPFGIEPTEKTSNHEEQQRGQKMVCLGGGAGAELVAFSGIQHLVTSSTETEDDNAVFEVIAVDIADWGTITETLTQHITSPPPLSKYASAAVREVNRALVSPELFGASFSRQDVLNCELDALKSLVEGATMITLMFTLNELYSTSLPLTQKFLLQLTSLASVDTYLLVVDSPGSYSTITLNGAEKKYPMSWLLDHTLLQSTKSEKGAKRSDDPPMWEKIHENESRWFRLDPKLKYPIDLENMRMQVHLYRRV